MFKKNLKKIGLALFSSVLTLSTLVACGTDTTNLQLQPFQAPAFNSAAITDTKPQHKYGLIFSSKSRKIKYDIGNIPSNGLAKSVDLRQYASPVADQGELGSCTAFAITKGLREYLLIKEHKPFIPLSPLFLYYNERKLEGDVKHDSGATLDDGMKVLNQTGVAPEEDWTYDISKFTIEPPEKAYIDAKSFIVKSEKQLNGLSAIKAELKNQNPVVFGIEVFQSFEEAKDGNIPVPDVNHEKNLGGHAVSCFGYDDAKRVLIMKNSWGPAWGDKGYFYLPYDYFKLGLVNDAWSAAPDKINSLR